MCKILLIALVLASACLVQGAKIPQMSYSHVIRVYNFMTSPQIRVLI